MQTYQGEPQLDALGDPSRRAIVALLAQAPAAVGQLAAGLPISRPAVSQHLRVLKDAGLVRDVAVGTRRVYELDATGVEQVRGFLDRFWHDDLERYAAFVEQQHIPARDAHREDPR